MPVAHAFVAKLTPDGSDFVSSTFLGGSGADAATGAAVDRSGNAIIGGFTGSTDFPLREAPLGGRAANGDGFSAKFDPAGALVWSTYTGGGTVYGVAAAPDGSALATGGSNVPTLATRGRCSPMCRKRSLPAPVPDELGLRSSPPARCSR